MKKKTGIYVFMVIAIIIVTVLGTTLAYFAATASNNGNNIEGETFDFGASISASVIYSATNLVPLSNNLVSTAISKENNKCIDSKNRDVCSLYRITLSNTGDTVSLTPFVTTTSTTYTTTNLKCQLYSDNFTSISDVITLSNTANGKVYITSGGSNINISLGSNSQNYYLVIWLMETSSSQTADYDKTFNGTITLEAGSAGRVYASFAV